MIWSQYTEDIKKIPYLSLEEEVELAKRAENGDIEARNDLISSHLRYVFSIAAKFAKKGHVNCDLHELVSVGNIGLIDAVDQFDWRLGNRLVSYAKRSIYRAIQMHKQKTSRVYTVPKYLFQQVKKYNSGEKVSEASKFAIQMYRSSDKKHCFEISEINEEFHPAYKEESCGEYLEWYLVEGRRLLTDKEILIFESKVFHNKTLKSIAEAMGSCPQQIKKRFDEARVKLSAGFCWAA